MANAPQPGMQSHQPLELGLGAIAGTIIDVDHLERPLAVERGGDLGHQACDIAGLVAHRHHDGHRRIVGIHSAGLELTRFLLS